MKGWIAVDLDGTLAHYDGWKGPEHIGAPIPAMVERVKKWVRDGNEVRIFTARAWAPTETADPVRVAECERAKEAIRHWCVEVFGYELPITCVKDYGMIEQWDDRAVQVRINTGQTIEQEKESLRAVIDGMLQELGR